MLALKIPSQPPVSYAQGCDDYSTSIYSCPSRVDTGTGSNIVLQRLTISDNDASRLIGTEGNRIKRLEESTQVNSSVFGRPGDRDRPVEIKGKQHQVSEALKIIHSIISS